MLRPEEAIRVRLRPDRHLFTNKSKQARSARERACYDEQAPLLYSPMDEEVGLHRLIPLCGSLRSTSVFASVSASATDAYLAVNDGVFPLKACSVL
jgi:hypothetical protein